MKTRCSSPPSPRASVLGFRRRNWGWGALFPCFFTQRTAKTVISSHVHKRNVPFGILTGGRSNTMLSDKGEKCMNGNFLRILLAMLVFIGVSDVSFLSAETYEWTDSDGSIHFSDTPPSSGKHPIVQRDDTTVTPSTPSKRSSRTSSTVTKQLSNEQLPKLFTPDTSNPAVAAFVAWHATVINGDFASFRALMPVMPNISNNMVKKMFDQIHLTAPKSTKITEPKQNDRDTIEFTSVGCNGNRPVVSVVYVRKIDEIWRVAGSGWGPSWNSKISEIVKCP